MKKFIGVLGGIIGTCGLALLMADGVKEAPTKPQEVHIEDLTKIINSSGLECTNSHAAICVASGFFKEDFSVPLIAGMGHTEDTEFYYTLDGNDPTTDSDKYEGPITISVTEEISIKPLKVAVYVDGEKTEQLEMDYLVCSDTENMPEISILSLTSDEYNLYDYDYGILVGGKIYDDNVAAGKTGYIEGNYSMRGDEWERDAHATLFDKEGETVFDTDVTLGVNGGTSAAFDVKSLKIKSEDKFKLCLAPDSLEAADYSFVEKYKSLKIRTGSQDMDYGNIRTSVMNELASESGFDGGMQSKRAAVFLNGVFYGLADIESGFTDSYIAKHFNLPDSDEVKTVKASEADAIDLVDCKDIFNADLTDESNCETLEKYVDMDNFLLYYAVNILLNNTDWPKNNFEFWYYGGEAVDGNEYTDGRLRLLLFDADLIYPTDYIPEYFSGATGDNFTALMTKKGRGKNSVFSNVLTSKTYRDEFLTILADLENTVFSENNLEAVIDACQAEISEARSYWYDEDYNESAENNVAAMKTAAAGRADVLEKDIKKYLELSDKFAFSITCDEGAEACWYNKNVYASETYENKYYEGTSFVITGSAMPGYTFAGFVVNGEKVEGDTLTVDETLIENGLVKIEVLATRIEGPVLVIKSVYTKGKKDKIVIKNVGTEDAQLSDYYVTDSGKKLKKSRLSGTVLKSGEEITLKRKAKDFDFGLSAGETLYLTDGKNVIDSVILPEMTGCEYYTRYKDGNEFRFVMKE